MQETGTTRYSALRKPQFSVHAHRLPHLDRTDLIVRARSNGAAPCVLIINGVTVSISRLNRGTSRFKIANAFEALASNVQLEVHQNGAPLPHKNGDKFWRPEPPFLASGPPRLDLEGLIATGNILSKKGRFVRPFDGEHFKKSVAFYESIASLFNEVSGYSLLISHGSLLGLWRDGKFIADDDDIDCFYVSRYERPSHVVMERNQLFREVARKWPHAELGPTGHLKMLNEDRDLEVDVMPAWIEDSTLHISSYASITNGQHLVSSSTELSIEGSKVLTLSDPEAFLEFRYGAQWRSPDPGYRYPPKTSSEKRNLKLLRPRRLGQTAFQWWGSGYLALAQTLDTLGASWFVTGRTLLQVILDGQPQRDGGMESGTDIDVVVMEDSIDVPSLLGGLAHAGFVPSRARGRPGNGLQISFVGNKFGVPPFVVSMFFLELDSGVLKYSRYKGKAVQKVGYPSRLESGDRAITPDLEIRVPIDFESVLLLEFGSAASSVLPDWDWWTDTPNAARRRYQPGLADYFFRFRTTGLVQPIRRRIRKVRRFVRRGINAARLRWF